jgi:small-conductance mechanosensitive channel
MNDDAAVQPDSTSSRSPQDAASQAFYHGALGRIQHLVPLLGVLFSVVAVALFGRRIAVGFVCGSVIAWLNFYWLERVVSGLADRITQTGRPHSSKGIVVRFLLRYLLMGLGAYAILSVSPASLYGLLAGLFLPIAAIACEAAYEIYATLGRGL